jgi:hypothetical protein
MTAPTSPSMGVASFGSPDGSVIVKKSQNEKPYYLCRVTNHWDADRYYGEHLIPNEEFATRDEAEARAKELTTL